MSGIIEVSYSGSEKHCSRQWLVSYCIGDIIEIVVVVTTTTTTAVADAVFPHSSEALIVVL